MKKFTLIVLLLCFSISLYAQENTYFEMRTYHVNEGKMDDLIKRFENHTMSLFEKHGITNVAYFLPTEADANFLRFILSYPDQSERDKRWNAFANDPEWQKVAKESEADGKLVAKVDQVFMETAQDLNPEIIRDTNQGDRIFELRTYTLHPGKVDAIHARFRDYTRELFQKHNMVNVMYWYTVDPQQSQPKLVYLLAHKNEKAAKTAFQNFGKDKAWITVRDASERNGKIVERVDSEYMKPLPFSPLN